MIAAMGAIPSNGIGSRLAGQSRAVREALAHRFDHRAHGQAH
jgi:hypothetical protein